MPFYIIKLRGLHSNIKEALSCKRLFAGAMGIMYVIAVATNVQIMPAIRKKDILFAGLNLGYVQFEGVKHVSVD